MSDALSKELDRGLVFDMMISNTESSTEVVRVKSGSTY